MREIVTPPTRRARAREPETRRVVNEDTKSVNQSDSDFVNQGKGGRKSGPSPSGTGAGGTFSESRDKEGGSDLGVNATGGPVQRGRRPVAPSDAAESVEAAPEAPEGQTADRRITRAGWRDVLDGDPEPGTGFFRFAAKDLPGLPERSRMAPTIECFGVDLANAHAHLRMIVAQARRVKTDQVDVSAVRPVAHRATRLCKRARQARGEV